MTRFFDKTKLILGFFATCFLILIFASRFFEVSAQEGKDCCDNAACGFGYTCIVPKNCNLDKNPGSCTQSIIECPNGYGCPAGMYCVDYVCVGFGPGTPTPTPSGGGDGAEL